MITRALATSHHSLDVTEKQTNKKLTNEMTFRTTTEFLSFWRAVLRYRYVTNLSAIHDYNHTMDGLPESGWPPPRNSVWLRRQHAVCFCHPCATMPDIVQAAPWRPEKASHAPIRDKRQHSCPGPKMSQLGEGWVSAPPGCGSRSCWICHSHRQKRLQFGTN